jgi:hypothetical protein
MLLLLPEQQKGARLPVVIGVAQQGKQEFLRERADAIAEMLSAGVAVCLPDLRGTGETSSGEGRGRNSAASSLSASELMLGQSLLGGRLRDLRSVLRHLRTRADLDSKRVALWGDSFAKVNAPDANFRVPYTAAERPAQSEPMGGLVALLGALFEEDVRAVYVHRGLSDFRSVLEGQFCYLPHDAVVPGVLSTGDLSDVAAAVAPRALWLDEMVDGLNRPVAPEELARRYEPARAAFAAAKAANRLHLDKPSDKPSIARWLTAQLNQP